MDSGGASRTLVKFALPTLPAGAIATDAILKLNKRNTTPAASEEIEVARVTSPWQYSVTWASKPTADTVFDVTEQSVVQRGWEHQGLDHL